MSPKTEKELRLIEERNERAAQRRRMEAEHGIAAMPDNVRDLIWERAWEDGHSEGYHRVEDIYEDLAEIAKAATLRPSLPGAAREVIALWQGRDFNDPQHSRKIDEAVVQLSRALAGKGE